MLVLQRRDARGQLAGPRVERRRRLRQLVAIALERLQRLEAGDRLDAADAGRDAALGHDRKQADVAGRAHVRAAAQLHAEAGNRDDADLVAVLLAEERHRAGGDRLLRVP